MAKPPRQPGLIESRYFPSFYAHTEGGGLDPSVVDLHAVYTNPTCIPTLLQDKDGLFGMQVAVRNADGALRQPDVICDWIHGEKTYAESERYAKALARAWHLEVFVFDRFEKAKRWYQDSTAVYRFLCARALEPSAGTHRWHLKRGAEIVVPVSANAVAAKEDRWDDVCHRIEEAVETFHRIAALADGDDWLQHNFSGPRKAIEATRAEARRLGALGQQLDGLANPSDAVVAQESRVLNELHGLLGAVQEAIAYLSEVHLTRPGIDGRPELEANLDLASMAAAYGERALLSGQA